MGKINHVDIAAAANKRAAKSLYDFINPVTVGTVAAATVSLYPRTVSLTQHLRLPLPLADRWLDLTDSLGGVPARVYLLVAGFGAGYSMMKFCSWFRWRALESLLSYQGWMKDGKSLKTKGWALLVKLLQGPGPHSTYAFQRVLPRQPLPKLNDSLDLWLRVAQQLLNKDEFEELECAVEEFRQKEGPRLHAFLQKKADSSISWLADYWMAAAYLSCRDSLAINSNYFQVSVCTRTSNPVARAANTIRQFGQFYDIISNENLPPSCLQGFIPLDMGGYRHLFNVTRTPGEYMDTISRYPGELYIIILCKGSYFKMELYAPRGGDNGEQTLLTAEEIKGQILRIQESAKGLKKQSPVAVLTSQNRALWSKQREVLAKKNKDTLYAIEASMFVLVFDDKTPRDQNECASLVMTGKGGNRWFDKCFNSIIFPDGTNGLNIEHSVLDATVFAPASEYCMGGEVYTETGDVVADPSQPPRTLPRPQHLLWNLSDVEDMITGAVDSFKKMTKSIDMCVLHTPFGKGRIKKFRLSPDGFIQLSFQLAFHQLHKQIVKTYEPSTGRLFLLGRTETIHPVSDDAVAWVRAMTDATAAHEDKVRLLRAAITYQNEFRLRATAGLGCDRHLLGLYCASRELGMDLPQMFMDKSWRMPFKLSTSQTPTQILDFNPDMDPATWLGGFGPSCPDGYGVSYIIVGDDNINICITSWIPCEETCSYEFGQAVTKAMNDMSELMTSK